MLQSHSTHSPTRVESSSEPILQIRAPAISKPLNVFVSPFSLTLTLALLPSCSLSSLSPQSYYLSPFSSLVASFLPRPANLPAPKTTAAILPDRRQLSYPSTCSLRPSTSIRGLHETTTFSLQFIEHTTSSNSISSPCSSPITIEVNNNHFPSIALTARSNPGHHYGLVQSTEDAQRRHAASL